MDEYEQVEQLCENYPTCKQAFNNGYAVGYDDEDCKNPYPTNSNEGRCWRMGLIEGHGDC